jgi:hypothetical protein
MPKLARAFFVADELAHQLAATYAHQATPLDTLSQQAADRSTRPRPCAAAHSSVTDRDRPPERSSPVADPLTQAPTYLAPLVADRQRRGTHTAPEHLEAAAALLVDLWAAAARHGITPDHHVWSFHLPRAALDTITAARKRRHADRARAGR